MRSILMITLMILLKFNFLIGSSNDIDNTGQTSIDTTASYDNKISIDELDKSCEMEDKSMDMQLANQMMPVQNLLDRIPPSQQDSFVKVLHNFAGERAFDWRLCLLVLFQESSLNPKQVGIYQPSFVGLAMFGSSVRQQFGLTRSQILKMDHLQQVNLAVRMWKENEKQRGVRIDGFLKLHIANFYPAWLKLVDRGGVLPCREEVKQQNKPLLMGQSKFTVDGLLRFYRAKVEREAELQWFVGKI